MQTVNRIHLVPSVEPKPVSHSESNFVELVRPRRNQALDARDIVRETLAIARDCRKVLASSTTRNHLLVDLVASLAVARLKKRGAR
jgi:hypothetical protein